jgi:molybdopterin-containing oxidoreductase family iron-sulfur binding subunit
MTVDVDRCTGCKACVIACNVENNVAVVGAEFSAMQRIVHWLRIEPIRHGNYPHLHTDFIPMLCQQCGAAPCESVCPVFASVHTHDGLNGQIYNRCIGTRVCANNCPYHVRMFNFITPTWPEPLNKMLNPDVTARSEGVMEKCTFCVQRIRRGNLDAKIEKRKALDGEIRPACVQACASEALVFGLLSDDGSTVSRNLERNEYRAVIVHGEHDTRPNVIYLKPERDPEALEPADRPIGEEKGGEAAEASPTPQASASASPSPVSSPTASGSPSPAATASPSTPTPSPATPAPVAPASPGMPASVTPTPVATP